MEKEQSLIETLKQHKGLVIGFVFIICILLIDGYILKPWRKARENANKGQQVDRSNTVQTTSSNRQSISTSTPQPAKLTPPPALAAVTYPALSSKIETRFESVRVYPFSKGRNVFTEIEKPVIIEPIKEIVEELPITPDISYHGFFTMGNDKVAVLKKSDEVLLTKVGTKVRRTTFKLASITPEKVVVTDLSNKLKDFEISLADDTQSN